MIDSNLFYAQFTINKKWFVNHPNNKKIVVTSSLMKFSGQCYLWGAEKYAIKICNSLSKQYEVHLFQQPGNFLQLKDVIVHGDMFSYFSRENFNKVAREIFLIKPFCIFCNAGGGQQVIFWSIISKMTNVPIVMFFHNEPLYIKNTLTKMYGLEYLINKKMFNNLDDLYDLLLRECDVLGFLLPQYVDEKYKNKSYVFYNCIDIPNNVDVETKRNNILYVGRINSKIKRTNLLLDVIKNTTYQCDIVGHNYEMDGFIDIEPYKKYNNLHFYGYQNDVTSFYRTANVLVIPSIVEGLPTVALEAMSYGVPIIGYKECKSMNDIIINGYNGWLVDNDLLKVINNNIDNITKTIRLQCIQESKKYGMDVIMNKIKNAIERTMDK